MPRGEQLMRQWNLLKRLQTRGEGFALKEMADEFGVSDRTIQRDLEILQEVGFPIEFDEDEFGKRFWRLPNNFLQAGPLLLTLVEVVSLQFAAKLFEPLSGTHYADALNDILAKLRPVLPREAMEHFADLDRVIHVRRTGVTDYAAHRDVVHLLDEAIRLERSLDVTYNALGRAAPFTTRFDPYGLVYYDGDLFVLGNSHLARDTRIYKVSRIASAAPTQQGFELPEDFDLESLFKTSFGIFQARGKIVEVVVRFTGIAAKLVEERTWHETQWTRWVPADQTLFEPEGRADDVLLAKFGLSEFVEFKRWIKGFGDMAEVLQPEWLRAELHDELLAAARLYEDRSVR